MNLLSSKISVALFLIENTSYSLPRPHVKSSKKIFSLIHLIILILPFSLILDLRCSVEVAFRKKTAFKKRRFIIQCSASQSSSVVSICKNACLIFPNNATGFRPINFVKMVEKLNLHVKNNLVIEHCCFLWLKHNKQCASLMWGPLTELLLCASCIMHLFLLGFSEAISKTLLKGYTLIILSYSFKRSGVFSNKAVDYIILQCYCLINWQKFMILSS